MTKQTSPKEITLLQFLTIVRVMRMLYGVQVATKYFEDNLETFTGHTIQDLKRLLEQKHSARLQVTQEDK